MIRKIRFSLIFFFIIISNGKVYSGSKFQEFLDRVNAALYPDRTAIVDSFMAVVPSFPFIEDSVAHFIYRGSITSATVPGDANLWDVAASPMTRLSSTDFYYYSQTFEPDARLDYKFYLNGSTWILDPRNPDQVMGGFGPNSELAMPGYIQPWEIQYRPAIAHGRTDVRSFFSTIRGVTYSINVYLPSGYDGSGLSYPTVYFQDGSDYINYGYAINILDNLIDSLIIQPMIAVFVTPINRNEEYAGSLRTQYTSFFVSELVPYIESLYRTIQDPQKRAVIGDSYGGNISALISYDYPGVFGNCGLHSGAFQNNNYEAYNLIVNGPVKKDSIRYCSVWGTYESSLTPNMENFRDLLMSKGYTFQWLERHEGHSWGQWRATTDVILKSFFPLVTGVKKDNGIPVSFQLKQNYPNPFNPSTEIRYDMPVAGWVTINVYDVLGREITTLVNGIMPPGEHLVRWNAAAVPSDVYFYKIRAGSFTAVKKMILAK